MCRQPNTSPMTAVSCKANITVFSSISRLDSARQRQTGGHGLGLAIAQGVVSAHGGHIQAFNRDDGQSGLVVRIVLPLATDDL